MKNPVSSPAETVDEGLVFQFGIERDTKVLTMRYAVSNQAAIPAYILDQLWGFDVESLPVVDKHKAYISFGEDGIVKIGLFIHPLPTMKSVYLSIVPYAHVLRPGESRKVELAFSLPIAEYNPYYWPTDSSKWQTKKASGVQLWIGYFMSQEDMSVQTTTIDDAYEVRYPGIMRSTKVWKSPVIACDLMVRQRQDLFERFD
ncbi:hypothetical protein [Candidatus Thiosymbion oneisti]|uniref:hypothetical protein n=1 Tax=Candidatus Thiosymbion oneisti TaxID=589554 RepID=UPI001060AED7|nr:hypothetical protein [Candidatus Thiosymbion oneisti]